MFVAYAIADVGSIQRSSGLLSIRKENFSCVVFIYISWLLASLYSIKFCQVSTDYF